ncbi:hypothetical protein [Atopomonas sediminilitoris]|uniref:hypothetical protein n=1 Tax=Atopomonas sediminilitoris TaxID=2919919 RepID=UPI001F4E5398|nr:hypothetical protein [Atopomonas sediminilitoris]MCJ8170805.1 hypothetical protein [Atopomonas sediminilitoris]
MPRRALPSHLMTPIALALCLGSGHALATHPATDYQEPVEPLRVTKGKQQVDPTRPSKQCVPNKRISPAA